MKKKTPDYNALQNRLMNEIGLDVDKDHYVVDQDSCSRILFNQKPLKVLENDQQRIPRGETQFDPLNNSKLMSNLFSHFNNKLESDGEPSVSIFYGTEPNSNGKSFMEARDSDNKIYQSRPYINDSLKMMDLMLQVSGERDIDLSEYDMSKPPKPRKR